MENRSAINDGSKVEKLYWEDLLKMEWFISTESLEGKKGVLLNPQEWIEHYYRIEGAIDYFEETTSNRK